MEGVADGTLEGDAMSASRSQSSEIGGCVCGGGAIHNQNGYGYTEQADAHRYMQMQPKTTDAPLDG